VQFGAFVDRLDAALKSVVTVPISVALEETPATAMWIRPPYRVGVTRTVSGVMAWIGIRDVVGRTWFEPSDEDAVERLAIGFAALLTTPVDERVE
jgi:hypothetical protein